MKSCQKGFSTAIVLLLILVILGVGAGTYYFGKFGGQPVPLSPATPAPSVSPVATPASSPAVAATPIATPVASPTSVPSTPGSNLFTSPEFGISFNYTDKNTGINGSKIQVKQIGNKIYVYSTSGKPEEGQYLEMFSKDKNDSLVAAVKSKILAGYSLSDCLVKTAQSPVGGQGYPAGYELAEISVPTGPNDDLGTISEKANKCPEKYVTTNGISYFLTDINHPNKFIFLSIGQYGIDSGISDKLWQYTIKFLP